MVLDGRHPQRIFTGWDSCQRFRSSAELARSSRLPESILCQPGLQTVYGEQDHWHLLQLVLENLNRPAGNLFFDVRTVTLMREHGIREIYTTDSDFSSVPRHSSL